MNLITSLRENHTAHKHLIDTPLQRGDRRCHKLATALAVSRRFEKPLKRFVLGLSSITSLKRGVNESAT
jgi:hypothetical protein